LTKNAEIRLYTQPACPSCDAAKAWLAERGVATSIVDIREDHQILYDFMDTGSRTTPTLAVGEQILEGFDPVEWANVLEAMP
jgi:glutaredoxin